MSVLTMKSDEYKTFPLILREYAEYTVVVKGNSEKTVCEYLLDLRTFFRFMKLRASGDIFDHDEFEKISISDISIEDVRRVSPEHIINYLMFAGFQRNNSTTTRMRKLSALKSFFRYVHVKRHYVETNPTTDIDAPKKTKPFPNI